MLDESLIGRSFSPHSADVEAGRLRLFAKAIGETRPEYCDEAGARSAGLPSLLAPPTFVTCLYMDVPDPFAWLRDLGIDLARVLHGTQEIRHFTPVYAGDRLTFSSRIADVLHKKRAMLTLLVKETEVANQQGVRVAACRTTIVVRGEQANAAKPAAVN
jgi:acyl dehydratase